MTTSTWALGCERMLLVLFFIALGIEMKATLNATNGEHACQQFNLECPEDCSSDLDENGVVNVFDLLLLLGEFGSSCQVDESGCSSCSADVNQSGAVDTEDLLVWLTDMGLVCDCLGFSVATGPEALYLDCPVSDWEMAIENWLATGGGVAVQSECGELNWTHDFDVLGFSCEAQIFTHQVNFTVLDACGCSQSYSSLIEVSESSLCEFQCSYDDPQGAGFEFCNIYGSWMLEDVVFDACWNPLPMEIFVQTYLSSIDCDGGISIAFDHEFEFTVPETNQSIQLWCWGSGSGYVDPVSGCTDPQASNYHVGAYEDDGSCTYAANECSPIEFQGYTYNVVEIGDQCWFSENLRSSDYTNGDAIEEIEDGFAWSLTNEGAQCIMDNDPENLVTYGRLYNGLAVLDDRGLCPSGWHVPTDADWMTLEFELGMPWGALCGFGTRAGGEGIGQALKASEVDNPGWNGTNSSGFSALPGGSRHWVGWNGAGQQGRFWSQSLVHSNACYDLWSRGLSAFYLSGVERTNFDENVGLSVRCLQD